MEFSIVKLPLVVFFDAVIYILPAGVGQNDCTAWFFPLPLAWRITASICLRSARVRLHFAGLSSFSRNPFRLLFQLGFPHQSGMEFGIGKGC